MNYDFKIENMFLGRVITLNNGSIEFSVSLDCGPRIINLKAKNGFNIMYQDAKDLVTNDCSAIYGDGKKWHIYGGHRLWLSPECDATYYPDNEKVEYELIENGIKVTPPFWDKLDVFTQICIEFVDTNKLKITHKVRNLGEKKKLCLWALTVMKAGGECSFLQSQKNTGFLANRNVVFWSYDDINDKRLTLQNDKITLKSDISIPKPFKIGSYNSDFVAQYKLQEGGLSTTFIKTLKVKDGEEYPDFYCNFETYCTHIIHEIESLSPMKMVGNDEELEHTEFWEIY